MSIPDGACASGCIMHAASCQRWGKIIFISTEHNESEIQENRYKKVLCEEYIKDNNTQAICALATRFVGTLENFT